MTTGLLDKADRALSSARLLLDAGDTDGATNRAYYAMFDAATAAVQKLGGGDLRNPPKTHSGLISAFGQYLVQPGKAAVEMGRAFNRIHELRMSADYLAEPVATDKAAQAINDAAQFVQTLRALLSSSRTD
jgi:uncharacterized protein (UPF0332 family)